MADYLRLGVNIDHVATIRNARGGAHPDPVRAAALAIEAGADGITAHLREDRRHISDADIRALTKVLTSVPLNLEMAATEEMLAIALRSRPHAACIVPERRQERTTEGGLDVVGGRAQLHGIIGRLAAEGIRVSLFIEPSLRQVHAAAELSAQAVEFHTGRFCHLVGEDREAELMRIRRAAEEARALGLECHAGHGLSYTTVPPIAAIPQIVELNIGHFLIGEAIFCGLKASIETMRQAMETGRHALATHPASAR